MSQHGYPWPASFRRALLDEEWAQRPIGELARKYDSVENHGWYKNLEPTLDELEQLLELGQLWIDYSGGTGILIDQLLSRCGDLAVGALLVDASPKFLRLALAKLSDDERCAFRWIRYLKRKKRLERLDEVLEPWLLERGVEVLTSTNAIHLYYQMEATLESWFRVVRPGGTALVQSGNIDNPDAEPGTWIIDQTVERLQPHARELVLEEPQFEPFVGSLDEVARSARYDELRQKFFLPVRPLPYYLELLEAAGFEIERVRAMPIEARVDEWYEFLAAYHEGVLGWAGGSPRIGEPAPGTEIVELRRQLLRRSLERLFEGAETFQASWTYITCRRP